MKRRFTLIAASFCAAALLAGCGKKGAEPEAAATPEASPAPAAAPATPGKEVLPGASSVRDALAKKEYERAVGALLALKGAAIKSPQTEEYMGLYDEVKFGLMDAAETDKKAAQALAMLRAASSGR